MDRARRFEGRTCVISGGTYGIGYAVAARFLSEGGQVVICSRSGEHVETACANLARNGAKVEGHAVDISDEDAVNHFAAAVVKRHGAVAVLVNNAFSQMGARVADTSTAQWLANFSATLHGTLFMTRAFIPLLRQGGGGSIVNISSVSGSRVVLGTSGYGAAKAGVEHLTEVVAVEEAAHGIRCNVVVVGGVATPSLDNLVNGDYDLVGRNVPLRRVAQPDEIANVVAFLASDEAAYVTAASIRADGGLSVLLSQSIDQSEYQSRS